MVAVRVPEAASGMITVSAADGVVTLDGDLPGLAQKRLAGVLAWWVPGARDVVNGIGVTPPEPDDDQQIIDAVRIALEKGSELTFGAVGSRLVRGDERGEDRALLVHTFAV